jgi:hypothetical protein
VNAITIIVGLLLGIAISLGIIGWMRGNVL